MQFEKWPTNERGFSGFLEERRDAGGSGVEEDVDVPGGRRHLLSYWMKEREPMEEHHIACCLSCEKKDNGVVF